MCEIVHSAHMFLGNVIAHAFVLMLHFKHIEDKQGYVIQNDINLLKYF